METVNRLDWSERYICIAHLNEITNLKERLDTCPLIELPDHGDLIDLGTFFIRWGRACGKMLFAKLLSAQYKYGYEHALDDIIECMENGDLCEYVDPYEIGGFMLCLKKSADKLKESKYGQTDKP